MPVSPSDPPSGPISDPTRDPTSDPFGDLNLPDTEEIALYVHWPFCQSKCPYCDFNSHVRDQIDQNRWAKALRTELQTSAARLPSGSGKRRLTSIFFGGGTPSLAAPSVIETVIETAQSLWSVSDSLEITLEANPSSVETSRLKEFREAGINRVSLGVQSLNDEALRFLGRRHNAAQALDAVEAAASLFNRFSFDLIYALPGQSMRAWEKELTQALTFGSDHLSVYQLTIEPGTAFHTAHRLGQFTLPEEQHAEALFDLTQASLAEAGLPAYEISNHAAPGAASRHNLTYWRGGDYLGIGPGAHGRLTRNNKRYSEKRYRLPEKWISTVEATGSGLEEEIPIEPDDVVREAIMMGLRLTQGVDLTPYATILPRVISEQKCRALIEEDLLVRDAHHLQATREGLKKLNALLDYLLN